MATRLDSTGETVALWDWKTHKGPHNAAREPLECSTAIGRGALSRTRTRQKANREEAACPQVQELDEKDERMERDDGGQRGKHQPGAPV